MLEICIGCMKSLQSRIARRAGVAQSTVSRALSNHPGIPDATRRKIQALAQQMGYVANPLVSSVFGAMRRRQNSTALGTLAFITAHSTWDGWKKIATYRDFFLGAQACAGRHGFGLESHWAADPELSGERLSAILEARGISGLLISTRAVTAQLAPIAWEKFALVRIGLSQRTLHQSRTIREAARRMALRGHRRIGLTLTSWQNEASDQNWLGGFLAWQSNLPRRQQVPVHLEATFTRESICAWQRRTKPDAVLTVNSRIIPWLAPGGLTPDRFALLDWHAEDHSGLAGMDQNIPKVGAAAVELLLAQIRHNERGFPEHPQTVLIESTWREPAGFKESAAPAPSSCPTPRDDGLSDGGLARSGV